MSQVTSIEMKNNGLSLKGDLLFASVSPILTSGCDLIDKHTGDSIMVDLSAVERIDSAGIALLLALKRLCDDKNKHYSLKGLSSQAASLISTNKLDAILR